MTDTATPVGSDHHDDPEHHLERPIWWWALRDTWTLTKRNLRHFVRQPRLLLFSTVQPIMFVLLFAYVFGGVAGSALPDDVDYIAFLVPGIFVQSTVFRASFTATALAEDLERGVIDRFRSMPMAQVAVLGGRTGADLVRSIAVMGLMIVVGYVIGFRFTQGLWSALGAVAIVALFGYGLCWLFTYVAMVVPGPEAAQSAAFVVIFPLVFASSIFVPLDSMPGWLQAFASQSPITHAADAARALSIGGAVTRPVMATVAWSLGIFVVFAILAARRFRSMT